MAIGSSATTKSGFVINALAITTRWRWPPESWCGYFLLKKPAGESPTFSMSSWVNSLISAAVYEVWIFNGCPMDAPMLMRGLNDAKGSWKMTWIFLRIWRMASLLFWKMDFPLYKIFPDVGFNSLNTNLPVVVFPQPLSPASPNTSPSRIKNETSSTA